ncbi:hypothetical protein EVAR_83169_1 [Eumeta japonica]|uniref:Uncharacterized protein n=1 Tax=Eumeta variegata TaxID=151549 RepID=A0A4C1YDE2_EUMVA|nr:hypothetical protein EVAR_83169_1 [Eumeta japonica]
MYTVRVDVYVIKPSRMALRIDSSSWLRRMVDRAAAAATPNPVQRTEREPHRTACPMLCLFPLLRGKAGTHEPQDLQDRRINSQHFTT